MVPVRDVVPVLSDTSYETVPLPVPLAPLLIVIKALLLAAAQVHPPVAVTANDPEPVPDPTVALVGVSE